MNCLLAATFLCAWGSAFSFSATGEITSSLLQGAKSVAAKVVKTVDQTRKSIPFVEDIIGNNCLEPADECPNQNITFWYYSRSNPEEGVKLSIENEASFDKIPKNKDPWKVIIHGYTKSKNDIPNPQLRSAYFKRGDYNLLSVDYEPLATDNCYVSAVNNVPLVGKCTAQMIDALADKGFFQLKNLHIIGFSLGAQVAGRIRENLKNGTPDRVTGLDPASPLFEGTDNPKLSKDAADFVDVIHTNGLFKGIIQPSGHVDFYANGGLTQPGCRSKEENSTASSCSHDRSPLYFAESINSPEGFWAVPCQKPDFPSKLFQFSRDHCEVKEDELVIVGEYTPRNSSGKYYFETTDKAPFALGKWFNETS